MASRKEWPSRPPLSPPSPFREVEVMKNTSFCELVRPSLYFLRMFGVMPVDLRDGSFRWATFRTAHCFLAVVVFLRAAVRWTIRILTPNDSNKATGAAVTASLYLSVVGFLCCAAMLLLSVRLARQWRAVGQAYDETVAHMRLLTPPPDLRRRQRVIAVLALAILVATLVGVVQSLANTATALTDDRVFVAMGRISITGADATCDLLLVVLSDTLAQNLRAFVARLREAVEQKAAPAFWEDARLTYGKLVDLIAIFDAKMGPFVILSFFQNGAYFCNTLTYILGFRPTNSSGNSTNLIFVAVRLFFVSLFTTNVHQEWLGLKLVLSNVPTESYSNAVLRFHSQVCSENVALTGLGVFSLTRQFLLSVVGFLTTFETILVQLGRH